MLQGCGLTPKMGLIFGLQFHTWAVTCDTDSYRDGLRLLQGRLQAEAWNGTPIITGEAAGRSLTHDGRSEGGDYGRHYAVTLVLDQARRDRN